MYWDIIFLDLRFPDYFDDRILGKKPLGGTEASVIRVAEGLGALGLKVAVVEGGCKLFRPRKGPFCSFIHASQIPAKTTCEHFVEVRLPRFPNLFPEAKKYLWLHNYGGFIGPEKELQLRQHDVLKYKVKIIGVSKWHERNLRKYFNQCEDFAFIYNMVPDDAYLTLQEQPKYDKNMIVWTASPHKGLDKAVELFRKIRDECPAMKFVVFNPGYLQADHKLLNNSPGISYRGGLPCARVWDIVKKALCVFYPGNQDEAFGCIASEANALGTPLATYKRGGIAEVVSSKNQLVKNGDEEALVQKVIQWHRRGRPEVLGVEAFKREQVIRKWCKVLSIPTKGIS